MESLPFTVATFFQCGFHKVLRTKDYGPVKRDFFGLKVDKKQAFPATGKACFDSRLKQDSGEALGSQPNTNARQHHGQARLGAGQQALGSRGK